MIFQSRADRNFEKDHQICPKKLAKNEEKPCSTCLYPFFSRFRVPENPISGTRSVTEGNKVNVKIRKYRLRN